MHAEKDRTKARKRKNPPGLRAEGDGDMAVLQNREMERAVIPDNERHFFKVTAGGYEAKTGQPNAKKKGTSPQARPLRRAESVKDEKRSSLHALRFTPFASRPSLHALRFTPFASR